MATGVYDVLPYLCEHLTLGDTCRLMRASTAARSQLDAEASVWAYYSGAIGLAHTTRAGAARPRRELIRHVRSMPFSRCVECGAKTKAHALLVPATATADALTVASRRLMVCGKCQHAPGGYRQMITRMQIARDLVGPAGWTPRKRKLRALYERLTPCKSRSPSQPYVYWRHQALGAMAQIGLCTTVAAT